MSEKELNERYFEWLYQLVSGNKYFSNSSYKKLLKHLHSIDFYWEFPMDSNRAEDGINMRYIFSIENDLDNRMVASYLDVRPCSVLEMIIGLAYRIETQIMSDEEYGDRTFCWFWGMIINLGLIHQTDDKYDEAYVDVVIERLMYHGYKPNGQGGLFLIEKTDVDLRNVEIWDQMNWYLNDLLENDDFDIDI